MTRIPKTLALSFVVALLVSGFTHSTASAQQGTIGTPSLLTLKGEQTGELLQNSFTAIGTSSNVTCPSASYAGHKYNSTPHELIESGSATVTITPNYGSECKANNALIGTRHAKVTMNGCDYVAHLGETTGGVEDTYGVSFDVVCPEGQKIELHVYNLATEATLCLVKIGPQSGLQGAHVRATTSGGDVDIEGTVEGIHEEYSGALCGPGTKTTSRLHLDITVEGEVFPQGITVSD